MMTIPSRTTATALCVLVLLAPGRSSAAACLVETGPAWHTDYATAFQQAEQQRKMLLVYFRDPAPNSRDDRFERDVVSHPCIAMRLARYLCVKLPLGAETDSDGGRVRLLEHPSLSDLAGGPGVAILDLSDPSAAQYRCFISALPFAAARPLSTRQLAVLLDLPTGTYEDRVLAYREALRKAPHSGIQRFIDRTRTVLRTRRRASEARGDWLADYGLACEIAQRRGKMLLVYFHEPSPTPDRCRFENESLADPEVQKRLSRYVCLRVPLGAEISIGGKRVRLLDDPRFDEMLKRPGLAVIDFAHRSAAHYGCVVSTFPMIAEHWYAAENVRAILDLPPGTLTQRTLIYAVRVHPERPASTQGRFDPYLAGEAEQHSEYQASILRQGHHSWDVRFQRISSQLAPGLTAAEVCAESWPGQRLLESAIECVRCWRLSSGHWRGVSTYHPVYGYDMKCGTNGVWYATGVFGEGQLAR